MKLEDIIKATNAEVIGEYNKDLEVRISTDTRTIEKGDLYLPLKGASFDGEKFIEQAFEKGAAGAFCTTIPSDLSQENGEDSASSQGGDAGTIQSNSAPSQGEVVRSTKGGKDGTLLKVPDTLTAYLQLANFRRNQINPAVVAVTGSSGKTTTKELISAVLSEKYRTFKTPLNHNNEIGLCQTIFEMPDNTEALVLEMGMRGLGEIELLSKYAEPDITVISNVGTAHIGRLGSRENIAIAKCEIVKHQRGGKWSKCDKQGKCVRCFIAHDDELIKKTVDFDGEKIFYSINEVNVLEKNANYSKFEYRGNVYELSVGGDYNIENALAAINIGNKSGLEVKEIQEGLKKYRPIEKRWEGVIADGYEIINDSYNANPESMRAFVDTIFELYDNYALVLGDMGELGEDEVKYHRELGQYINSHKKLNPNTTVITIGTLSENISKEIESCKSLHFKNIESAVNYIKQNISKNCKIFLKASRSMKFENIIKILEE